MVQVTEQSPIRFRVWDFDSQGWVQEDLNNYVELNWYLVGGTTVYMECFVEVINGANAIIVCPDENGKYVEPTQE